MTVLKKLPIHQGVGGLVTDLVHIFLRVGFEHRNRVIVRAFPLLITFAIFVALYS